MMEQGYGAVPEGLPQGRTGQRTGDAPEKLPDAAKIQILSTEHWSLLATRSLSYNESFSRTSMFLTALTGSVVALALVAQAMPGDGFVVFALLLLPIDLFLGVATYARLVAINNEDIWWVVGMNRLRHAYLELAPDLEKYFISGTHDDIEGIMQTLGAKPGPGQFLHGFVTTPGMVGVIDSVIAGVLAGVAVGVVGAEVTISIVVGVAAFVGTLALLMAYMARSFGALSRQVPRFPRAEK